jgi:hypothetical protein
LLHPSFGSLTALRPPKRTRAKRTPPFDGTAKRDNPLVPREWLSTPLFPVYAAPDSAPSVVKSNNRIWLFGVPNPLTGEPSHPRDIEHAAVFFTVCGFYQEMGQLLPLVGDVPPQATFSLNELARRVASYQDGVIVSKVLRRLSELRNVWVTLKYPPDANVTDAERDTVLERTFPLLANVDLSKVRQLGTCRIVRKLERVMIHPELAVLMRDINRSIHFRLAPFRQLRSEIARAIYLYMPSRAYWRDAKSPYQVSLTRLLTEIGAHVPAYPSYRRRIFTQHGAVYADTPIDGRRAKSILAQLDGLEMNGGKFRCCLRPNANGDDSLFCCWRDKALSERRPLPAGPALRNGALARAYRAAGGTDQDFDLLTRAGAAPELDALEAEWLAEASIQTENSSAFFKIAKALLGVSHFHELLREAVQELRDRPTLTHNPTGLLISRIVKRVRSLPPKLPPKGNTAPAR